jgi:hypothetical protein
MGALPETDPVIGTFWDGVWVGAFVALAVAGAVWMFTSKGGRCDSFPNR